MSKLFILLFMLSGFSFANNSIVAVVKVLKGTAYNRQTGKSRVNLKQDDKIMVGSVVETDDKSFVRLLFIQDKSIMNIGPKSEFEIKKVEAGDAGVLDLVKGQIRSQVSKDRNYLKDSDPDKSKLLIKTPNAVMGIRGTDFLVSTNGHTSSAILFEGTVIAV